MASLTGIAVIVLIQWPILTIIDGREGYLEALNSFARSPLTAIEAMIFIVGGPKVFRTLTVRERWEWARVMDRVVRGALMAWAMMGLLLLVGYFAYLVFGGTAEAMAVGAERYLHAMGVGFLAITLVAWRWAIEGQLRRVGRWRL